MLLSYKIKDKNIDSKIFHVESSIRLFAPNRTVISFHLKVVFNTVMHGRLVLKINVLTFCDNFVTLHFRIRKALENRTNMEDDRVSMLEGQLSQAKLIAEEADKKYEEVQQIIYLSPEEK